MNAEALIGTVLGTCTLQKLIGQGGMGAVFLAQQSRPRRQVAVKVLFPITPLSPHQLTAFSERFKRETDAAASLEHPNITPVYEYGERDGVAYLVMPYISGGTLRDALERENPSPLEKVVYYLDQMAAALDFAHDHGVIHRDIKPANILMTPEERLLLTDFGLVKIVVEGETPQIRLTGAGAPVGTPDYMAPEQVIGEDVDARADLYSLAVILYQMITGTTPFQGETPMQIAAQHLQLSPPLPTKLRPDLPVAAEQVILRAMAKRPAERYETARDLAYAFRSALIDGGINLGMSMLAQGSGMFSRTASTDHFPKMGGNGPQTGLQPKVGTDDFFSKQQPIVRVDGLQTGQQRVVSGGLLSRTGMFPQIGTTNAMAVAPTTPKQNAQSGGGLLSRTGKFPLIEGSLGNTPLVAENSPATAPTPAIGGGLLSSYARQSATFPAVQDQLRFANTAPAGQTTTNMVKLTGPVKVVQVPVAGQPGRYVTGLLPVQAQEIVKPDAASTNKEAKKSMKVISFIIASAILLSIASTIWFMRTHNQPTNTNVTATNKAIGTPAVGAKSTAPSTTATDPNLILHDPLTQNQHGWPTNPSTVYAFKDGAYHITNQGDKGQATILQPFPLTGPVKYTLTMDEVRGDDGTTNNSFGLIFRFSQSVKAGKTYTTFYTFEVENTKGGSYRLWKYDDSKGTGDNAWTDVWHASFGPEFHQGQGAQNVNMFSVLMNDTQFVLSVNGKMVTTVQDKSFTDGTVGMIINQKGTEVAFKELYLIVPNSLGK